MCIEKPRKTLSEYHKKRISEGRIKYLLENPDKVPYKLNHSSKESYPEKYFNEVFEKENIEVIRYHRIGLYELDFSILEKKIDIEIDGEQHYYDQKIIESDKRRTQFLESNGWDVIRIRWSHFVRLIYDDKRLFIENLKLYINNLVDTKPRFDLMDIKINSKKSRHDSCVCGNKKNKIARLCMICSKFNSRKAERPPIEILLEDVGKMGYKATGRKYGVSDNAIRKWIKIEKTK